MAEYIEREALINEINLQKKSSKTSFPKRSFVVGDVLTCIYTAPAADVVEVVRCKECKEWSVRKAPQQQDKFGFCACNLMDTHEDFFCAYGERKENHV